MPEANLVDRSLSGAIEDMLSHIRPETDDAEYLDRQSREQVEWFTYRPGYQLSKMTDGNRLVPDAVAEVDGEEYPGQSFPVNQRVTLLLPEEEIGEASMEITVGGFQPAEIAYDKPYPVQWSQVRGMVHEDLEGGTIGESPIEIAGEGTPKSTAAPPVGFEHTESISLENLPSETTIEVPSRSSVLRYCDRDGTTLETTEVDPFGRTQDSLDPDPDETFAITYQRNPLELRLEVEILDDAPAGYQRIAVELRNLTDVDPDGFVEKHLATVLNPGVSVTFDGVAPVFPAQQHADSLRQEFDELEVAEDVRNLRTRDTNLYTQRNAILTQSVRDPQTFLVTAWGVYDFVEQVSPEEGNVDIDRLATDRDYLLENLDRLDDAERIELQEESSSILDNLQAILGAVPDGLGIEDSLYSVQWAAIQERIQMLLNDDDGALVVRAPTSAGKTAVYFISTALIILERDTRAFLPFPTTTLTDGMLGRLIDFVTALNRESDIEVDCGVVMGKDTNPREIGLERAEDVYLDAAEFTDYIEECHHCGSDQDLTVQRECAKCGGGVQEGWTENGHHKFQCEDRGCRSSGARHHLVCGTCGYEYDFVYDHDGTVRYLPDFVVGTPDKLYQMATVQAFSEHSTYSPLPFFGAPYSECDHCGRALTDMNGFAAQGGHTSLHCDACSETTDAGWNFHDRPAGSGIRYSPIGHVVLDETHMYTGEFGAGISVMAAFLRVIATRFRNPGDGGGIDHRLSVDAGTATTGNALEHIQRLIREDSPRIVPTDAERGDHFETDADSVRYRILAMRPVGTTNRNSFRRGMVHLYRRLGDADFEAELEDAVDESGSTFDIDRLRLLLGYVYRKSDGTALSETIQDLFRRETGGDIQVPFMSGAMSKGERRRLINDAEALDQRILLANMVVSLGLDIDNLNNMIMYGACRSTAEQIQAVGRTGRGDAAGHAAIHLFPNRTRDAHLYTRFHDMLANVDDYVEKAIIQPTNPHVTDQHFLDVLSPLLTTQMTYLDAGYDHEVSDLIAILERMDSPTEIIENPTRYGPDDPSSMHLRLLEDLRTIFSPEDIDIPGPFQDIIYARILDMYRDCFRPENGLIYERGWESNRLNKWFQVKAEDGGLRGSENQEVTVTMETDYEGDPQ